MRQKYTVKQIKEFEDLAYDLYNYMDCMTLEAAQKLQAEIYQNPISYDYGDWDQQEELKDYYTKAALKLITEDYDWRLTYANMRAALIGHFFNETPRQVCYNDSKYNGEFDVLL